MKIDKKEIEYYIETCNRQTYNMIRQEGQFRAIGPSFDLKQMTFSFCVMNFPFSEIGIQIIDDVLDDIQFKANLNVLDGLNINLRESIELYQRNMLSMMYRNLNRGTT